VHKTGTSVVQQFLLDNRAALAERRALVLTRGQMADFIGWGDVLLENPRALMNRIAEFRASSEFDLLIGSNENALGRVVPVEKGGLYPRAGEIMSGVARAVRHCRMRVMLSLRPQHEFLESYYLQTVHQGSARPFTEWLDGIDLDALSWRPLVSQLEDIFGAANVDVLDFRLLQRDQSEYVRRFLSAAGPELDFPVESHRSKNRSISDKGLKMALAANKLLAGDDERRAMRRFLQRHFSNLDYPRAQLLTPHLQSWLEERYGPEYDELVALRSAAAG
jgi:hypothetical protein